MCLPFSASKAAARVGWPTRSPQYRHRSVRGPRPLPESCANSRNKHSLHSPLSLIAECLEGWHSCFEHALRRHSGGISGCFKHL